MMKFLKYSVLVPMLLLALSASAQAGVILSVTQVASHIGGGSLAITATSDAVAPTAFNAFTVNILLDNYQGANLAGQDLPSVIFDVTAPGFLPLALDPLDIGITPDPTSFATSAFAFGPFDPGAGTDLMTITFTTPGIFTAGDSIDVTILPPPVTSAGLNGVNLGITLPGAATTISGVPEPGTALMMGVALAAVGALGWRRRRRQGKSVEDVQREEAAGE